MNLKIEAYEKNHWSDVKIIDSKITKLEKIASFDTLLSSPLEMWSLEYQLKPEDISKVVLAGGMNEVDGWITEESSMGKPILIFSYEGSDLQYLGSTWSGEADFSTSAGQEMAVRVFLERIDLLPHETYSGNHILIKFPMSTGETSQLFLSQPVLQGDLGIWCVERWKDTNGNVYYDIPQTNVTITDYYKELQKQCDDGHQPSLLDPLQVAINYINNEIGQNVSTDQLIVEYAAKVEDFAKTPESHLIGFISNFNIDSASFEFDKIEWLTEDNTKRLKQLNITLNDMPNGYYIYNADTYTMRYTVTNQTEYNIINWEETVTHKSVTMEEFISHFNQYSQFTPPCRIIIQDGYVLSITEQYVP